MMDILTILVPVFIYIFYFAVIAVIIKLVIFAYQTPKEIRALEKRIKQLEDERSK